MGNTCCRRGSRDSHEKAQIGDEKQRTRLSVLDGGANTMQSQQPPAKPKPAAGREDEAGRGGGRKQCAFLTQTCRGHTAGVNCMTVNEAGDLVATGSDDCTVRMWQLAGGELKEAALLRGHLDYITCARALYSSVLCLCCALIISYCDDCLRQACASCPTTC